MPLRLAPLVIGLAVLLAVAPVHGQNEPTVIDTVEQMDFDRPEAWALELFTSASLLTGLGPVDTTEPGSIEVGFELMSMPHLDTEQRTVGFNGVKEEDLNRTPAWGRLRVTFGLPADFSLTLGAVPPLEVDGVTANLYSIAIARPLYRGERSTLGLRLHTQFGDVEGDLTCGEAEAAIPPGAPGNEFGCNAASNDEVTLDYYGAELVWSRRFEGRGAPAIHVGASLQEMDLEFQVNAQTFGILDRTLLLTDGSTWSVEAGASWQLGARAGLSTELFYSPLDVVRATDSSPENDALLNLRVLLRYRVR